MLSKGTVRGSALQTAIIQSLTPGSILQYHIKKDLCQSLKIAGRVGFIPFNSKLKVNQDVQEKDMFKRNFNSLLTACFNNPDSNFIATPQYKEHKILRTSQTSLGIDFVIGVFQSTDKKNLIRTYDTTVEESPSSKVLQFNTQLFPQLSRLAKEGGYTSNDIEFQHVVPSLKQTYGTTFGDPLNGFTSTIVETNLFKLKIKKSANEQAVKALALTLQNCEKILTERKAIEKLAQWQTWYLK